MAVFVPIADVLVNIDHIETIAPGPNVGCLVTLTSGSTIRDETITRDALATKIRWAQA